jgi:hypothetical protein
LPVGLILEDGCEVANNIDYAKDESVFRPHGDIRAMCITRHGTVNGSRRQQFVHPREGTNLGGSGIYSEDERKNDRKQDRCMSAIEGLN